MKNNNRSEISQRSEISLDTGPESKFCDKTDQKSSEISDLLLFVSYFASQTKRIKFADYFFDVWCAQ